MDNNPIRPFIDTVLHLDEQGNVADLVHFIQTESHPFEALLEAITELLVMLRLRPAFLLAMFLRNNNYHHPISAIALVVGGWLFNKPEEARVGLELVRMQADALSFEQQTLLYDRILHPIQVLLLDAAIKQANHDHVLRILDLYAALFPRFRTLYDWRAPVPTFSLAAVRQRGRAEARLISYPLPDSTRPRPRRRVVVAMREWFCFGDRSSRVSDFGPRILAAMQAYGWEVHSCTFKAATLPEIADDCRIVAERCRQQRAELLVIDLNLTIKSEARDEMILQLRQENPAIRVVGCLIDSFCFPEAVLVKAATHLDLIWTRDVPFLPAWSAPALANKVFNLLFPNAGLMGRPEQPLIPQPFFAGGVSAKYIPHRAFWLAGIERLGLPIQSKISSHMDDGLSPLDSFALYMRGLTDATCCLNFSMRSNQDHVVTFRSFEVVLSGALLIQEATPEMDAYFVAGDHYLPFSTLAELASVIRFITEQREEAEEIRRCGNAFARERYSDEKIIGYLDRRLFFPA
ncbi:MAG: glycosyltransferase family 1 protein [Magnetococcales bacterium]|nr:glycosyltransferase family 1 protein [Magnetococcales bacterium]